MGVEMSKRLLVAFAAMVMWLAFGLVVGAAFIVFPVLTAVWVCNGSEWLRDRLTKYGQALDSCANVPFLDGHPKETISSHVGRFYTARYGNAYKLLPATNPDLVIPWQCVFVRWLTDKGEPDHVYKAVEQWAVDAKVPL